MVEEKRLCQCGCGEVLKGRVGVRFKQGHKKIGPKPTDVVVCACGCGQRIPWNSKFARRGKYPRYINFHQNNVRKGKSNIELFGKEKAVIMGKKPKIFGEKISKRQLGKTLEERWGEETAKEAKEKIRKKASRSYEERLGEEKASELKEQRRRKIKIMHKSNREKRELYLKNNPIILNQCKCGCGGNIKSDNKNSQFLSGHQNRIPGPHNKGIINGKYFHRKNDIVICACGCGEQIMWKDNYMFHNYPKYKYQHHMKIPKDVLYGSKENFEKINKKISETLKGTKKPEGFGEAAAKRQLGKTTEERWGKETADKAKEKIRISASRTYEERLGVETAERIKKLRVTARLGKTYVELFGIEGAKKIREKQGEKDGYGRGKNETKILDVIEKEIIYKIDRNFWIVTAQQEFFKPDGYIEAINVCIEIDEKYHRNNKKEDKEREEKIKKYLNCEFIRINEKKILKIINCNGNIKDYLKKKNNTNIYI